jgi:hypothetical protein
MVYRTLIITNRSITNISDREILRADSTFHTTIVESARDEFVTGITFRDFNSGGAFAVGPRAPATRSQRHAHPPCIAHASTPRHTPVRTGPTAPHTNKPAQAMPIRCYRSARSSLAGNMPYSSTPDDTKERVVRSRCQKRMLVPEHHPLPYIPIHGREIWTGTDSRLQGSHCAEQQRQVRMCQPTFVTCPDGLYANGWDPMDLHGPSHGPLMRSPWGQTACYVGCELPGAQQKTRRSGLPIFLPCRRGLRLLRPAVGAISVQDKVMP